MSHLLSPHVRGNSVSIKRNQVVTKMWIDCLNFLIKPTHFLSISDSSYSMVVVVSGRKDLPSLAGGYANSNCLHSVSCGASTQISSPIVFGEIGLISSWEDRPASDVNSKKSCVGSCLQIGRTGVMFQSSLDPLHLVV
jgi:hypothetical protein